MDSPILDTVIQGNCLEVLRSLPDNSVDAIVTDPPYGLGEVKDIAGLLQAWIRDEDDSRYLGKSGFMGKEWDAGVPGPRYWREVLRVMKPGAHILCFASTRTVDLMMIALRLAGFQCRDTLMWVYGQGFPKSTAIDKKIDRLKGAKREVLRTEDRRSEYDGHQRSSQAINTNWRQSEGRIDVRDVATRIVTAPSTPEAQQYSGFGTALKPAHEPIILARKSLSEKSIAANVLRWGAGGLNIDACRVETHDNQLAEKYASVQNAGVRSNSVYGRDARDRKGAAPHKQGRFPANLLLSHSLFCTDDECTQDCPIWLLDEQSGIRKSGGMAGKRYEWKQDHGASAPFAREGDLSGRCFADQGGASRYFTQFCYTAKASRTERNRGCEGLSEVERHTQGRDEVHWIDRHDGKGKVPVNARIQPAANHHPTVKPIALMSWLCRLITPLGGTVLDCFAGSGSTCVAALREGFHFIGIEQEAEYVEIARARIAHAMKEVN